jgi:hypothetical protein
LFAQAFLPPGMGELAFSDDPDDAVSQLLGGGPLALVMANIPQVLDSGRV